MKQLLDFLPILFFFGAYKFGNIYTATAVLMAATVVQMAILYGIERKLSPMHKVMLVMVLLFGTLTLALHDERFIKWKPSVLYFAMALALGVAFWGFKRNYLQLMLGAHFALPDPVWARLTGIWVLYCLFMASLNGYAAMTFSTSEYVNFKLWGYAIPLVFILLQGIYIARHLLPDNTHQEHQ